MIKKSINDNFCYSVIDALTIMADAMNIFFVLVVEEKNSTNIRERKLIKLGG